MYATDVSFFFCVCVCASLFRVHVTMFMYIVEDLEKFGVTEFIQFVLDKDFFFFFFNVIKVKYSSVV